MSALAQSLSTFPTKPIKILVPNPAGGCLDAAARQLGNALSTVWAQPVVVENRPGAASAVAGSELLRAQPDGHTLMIDSFGGQVIYSLTTKLPFDTWRDFTPIATISQHPLHLAVRAGLPVKSVGELAALAKSKPGTLTFGSPGKGTESHLVMELFKQVAGVDMVHVPYKGGSAAVVDMQAGRIEVMVATSVPLRAGLARNEIRILATLSSKRVPTMPDVPTVAESGYPRISHTPFTVLFAPAKTPISVLAAWSDALNKVKRDKALVAWAEGIDAEITIMNSQQVMEMVSSDLKKWKFVTDKVDLAD